MKMMQEKQNCFDDCECNFDDCCEPRKCCHEECHECRRHCDDDCHKCRRHCDDDRHECKKRCKDAPEGGKALLRCGSGAAGPLPILGSAGLIPTTPIPVGSVSIDTRNLCNPTVLITVTALINTPVSILSSLSFRIVRCIDGCSQHVGGSYTFSNAVEALSSDSFTFQYCDCAQCCGCATYSIEVSNATLIEVGTTINATISALAVENKC